MIDLKEKTLESQVIYEGKILTLSKDTVLLPNGEKSVREKVSHGGGAAVLAVRNGCIYLVRQYRYPYLEEVWEIPAGKIEKGEDPLVCAQRELEEETGLRGKNLSLMGKMYPTPGYTNEVLYIYLATDFEEGKAHLDSDEFLTVKQLPLEEVYAMIERGEIVDGKTLFALLKYYKDNHR